MKNIIISSMIDLTKEVFTLIKKDYEVFLVSIDFNPDYDNLYKIADDLPPFYFNQVSYYLNFNFDDLPNTVLGNYLKNKDLKEMKAKVSKANYEQRQYNNLDFLYANNTNNDDNKGDN